MEKEMTSHGYIDAQPPMVAPDTDGGGGTVSSKYFRLFMIV